MRDDTSSRRRLELDRRNGMLVGVCAGLARYLRVDPLWVRVGAIASAVLMTKLMVAAYVIAWLVLDERNARPD
jgi:phage shock protein C